MMKNISQTRKRLGSYFLCFMLLAIFIGFILKMVIYGPAMSTHGDTEASGFEDKSLAKNEFVKNDLTDYDGSLRVGLGNRLFDLPFGYYGKRPQDYVAGYPERILFVGGLVARYPKLEEGFPFFSEKDRGASSDQAILIQFFLLKDEGVANHDRATYSSQKDFDQYVNIRTRKSISNSEEKTDMFGFEGYKKNASFWGVQRNEFGKALYILGCEKHLNKAKTENCNLIFRDEDSGLGFIVLFPINHLNEWESIRDKSVSLIRSFEKEP